jgi:hypothetical protein
MTPEAMAFFVQHTTGIVCAGVKGEILDRLQIPLMVPDKDNEEALLTAFTVTVVITQLSVRTICNCGCSPTTIWKGAYCAMIAFNCNILAPLKWEQNNY